MFGELEAVLASLHAVAQTKRTAFQSRLKNFHRLGYPIGFQSIKGRPSTYSPSEVVDMALAVEMTQLGLPPERASTILGSNRWPTLMALRLAASSLEAFENASGAALPETLADGPLQMFIYFDPGALGPLTVHLPASTLPDVDEATSSFFYGGLAIVREHLQAWTSNGVSRISMINLTSLINSILDALYPSGRPDRTSNRAAFISALHEACSQKIEEWEGGTDEDEGDAIALLVREQISDPVVLALRLNIPAERAARYIFQASEEQMWSAHDSNSKA